MGGEGGLSARWCHDHDDGVYRSCICIKLWTVQVLDLVDDGPGGVDLHHDGDDNEAVPQEASAASGLRKFHSCPTTSSFFHNQIRTIAVYVTRTSCYTKCDIESQCNMWSNVELCLKVQLSWILAPRVNKKPQKFIFEYRVFHKNPYLHTLNSISAFIKPQKCIPGAHFFHI